MTSPSSPTASSIPVPIRYALEAVLIYLTYNLLGDLNREFTPPPTGISPIWLPAGFAVGIVLTRGWWTVIPLMATGFINTVQADWYLTAPVVDGGSDLPSSTVLWAATLYAAAVVAHCVVAKLLIDRIRDDRHESVWSATVFLLVVGPISCIPSALLGTEVFRVEGFVTADTFAVSAFTFWLGDSMASMLLAPVFIAVLGGPTWRSRRTPIIVLAAATTVIVLASTSLVGRTEIDRIEQMFDRSATRAVASIEQDVRRLEGVALDQSTLVSAAGNLTASQFERSASDKVTRVDAAELIAYVATDHRDIASTSVVHAAGDAHEDFRSSFTPTPVTDYLRTARDTGRVVWVPRGIDPGAVHDFLFAPVYDDARLDAAPGSMSRRRDALRGFIVVRTDLQDTLERATESIVDEQSASVVRSEAPGVDPVLLASLPNAKSNPLVDPDLSPLAAARTKGVPFASSMRFELDGAPWSVTFAPSRSFVTDRAFLVTVLPSSLIALAFTLTIGILTLSSSGQRARLERLVRRRTRSLRVSERRYRSVVDNVREAIFQLDEDDRVTFTSSAWSDELAIGGGEGAIGRRLADALRISDPHRVEHLLQRARSRPGQTIVGELESVDQERVWEIRVACPAPDQLDEGVEEARDEQAVEAQSIVGLIVDSTEQRRVLRNRERFISLVAHELRNPLTVITGSIATIDDHEGEHLPPLTTKLLPGVLNSAHKLDRIISDLLVSSQVDAGTLTLMTESTDVRALVRESAQSATMRAAEHGVKIVAGEQLTGAGALRVTCDVDRVAQVVDNLLSNAIKYTPAGGTVTVSAELDPDRRMVRVTVADTGIGIAAQDFERVFDRYGRTEQGAIVAPGTGLGLSICRSIAEAHGGTIDVESELGVGSTFTLLLPAN